MKVKEVLALAAANLGREDLASAVSAADAAAEGELKTLLGCYNSVENEVALDYYPLVRTDRMEIAEGKIYYTMFSRSPVCIYGVRTSAGRALPYEKLSDRIETEKRRGPYLVIYSYAPAVKALGADVEADPRVSPRLLALGAASEFCLVTGKFREAELWESRYRDALRAVGRTRKKLAMRSRRWD